MLGKSNERIVWSVVTIALLAWSSVREYQTRTCQKISNDSPTESERVTRLTRENAELHASLVKLMRDCNMGFYPRERPKERKQEYSKGDCNPGDPMCSGP